MGKIDMSAFGTPTYTELFDKYVRTGFLDKSIKREPAEQYHLPNSALEQLKMQLAKQSLFRRLARTVNLTGGGTGTAWVSDSDATPQWLLEGQGMDIISQLYDYKKLSVSARKLAVLARLDHEVLEDSPDATETLVRELVLKFAEAEDEAISCGEGGAEPVGVVTQAETGAEADTLTWESLVALYTSVKSRYRTNGVWVMSDSNLLALRTMTTTTGMPVLAGVHADELMGHKVESCASMDDASILFGDWGYLWICQRQEPTVSVLRELFAERGQLGFRSIERLDSVLVRAEAIKKLTITA